MKMTTTTRENLQYVDTRELVSEFERELLNHCGHWVGVRLDPATGGWYVVVEPSRNVSCNEYFNESGVLSEMTVLSGQTCEYPGPEDGYEWEDDSTGSYVRDENCSWCCYDQVIKEFGTDGDKDVDTVIAREGLTRFSVSTTPVDPDYSYRMKEVQDQIDERIELIRSEIE